jgi:hypothetical protein
VLLNYRLNGTIITIAMLEHRLFFLFFFFLLLFICAYKAWVISPPCPHPLPYHPLRPLPLPPTPSIPSRNYFALISNFVEESISNNRKEKGFFLVEIRVAIQGVDSH